MSERLCEWVREGFGIDLVWAHRVHEGADTLAEVWRGAAADGSSYAVKLSGGGSAAGLIVCAQLAINGVAGVPRPLPTTDGRLWIDHEDRRLSLTEWVSDERAFDGDTTDAHWIAYGRLLANVHALAVTPELAAVLPRETHTHQRIADLTRDVDRRLRGPATDELVEVLARDWIDADVLGVVRRADELGQQLRARDAAPMVVCHADPHLGNLLIGRAGEVWLIDWDDVIIAPPERDLMFPLGGVFGDLSESELRLFFDAYGPVDIDPVRLAYYRSVRALEDAAGPAAQVLEPHRWTEAQREEALGIVQSVLSPDGLIAKSQYF